MAGTMGVWESETIIEPQDILRMLRVSLRPAVLVYLATLPFRILFRREKRS